MPKHTEDRGNDRRAPHRARFPLRWRLGVFALTLISYEAAGLTSRRVWKIEPGSEEIRRDYLRSARVWRDVETSEMDILAGPAPRLFSFDQSVTCTYHTPGRLLGGASTKFLCEADGVVYRVKYLRGGKPSSNREVFAEVAATRLFWALGFGADRAFPVRILCHGCPADPQVGPTLEERRDQRYQTKTRSLGLAVIELPFEGATIEEGSGQGWTWSELDALAGTSGARREIGETERAERRKHVEALKLLQVFAQHGDCKPQQQRLVCLPDGILDNSSRPDAWAAEGNEESGEGAILDAAGTSCTRSFALVDDLGSTFGGAGDFTTASAKMDLTHWAEKEVIDHDHYLRTGGQCKAVLNVSSSCEGGIENPLITESGRRFLVDRLSRLSDLQVRDLFVAARVDQLETNGGEHGREATVDSWVRAFKDKVQQLASVQCSDP